MMKAKVDVSTVQKSAGTLRDLKNWIAVFEEEYDIPAEAVKQFHEKIDEVADHLKGVHCVLEDGEAEVEKEDLDKATDAMRDLKNWAAVFRTTHELSDEAAKVMNEKVEALAQDIANIECE